ncbi:TPA: phage regulatory CII family protein [Aeromonas hydrophila]
MSNCQQNLHRHFASACDRFKQVHNLTDLAAQIGMSADVLRNKFNPAQARHKLTATDLIDLYRVTGDDTLFDGLLFDCQLGDLLAMLHEFDGCVLDRHEWHRPTGREVPTGSEREQAEHQNKQRALLNEKASTLEGRIAALRKAAGNGQ